jgi:hypothetical protein
MTVTILLSGVVSETFRPLFFIRVDAYTVSAVLGIDDNS